MILYADKVTGSMERAMAETDRRREKQVAYNLEHGITPTTVAKGVADIISGLDNAYVTAKLDKAKSGGKTSNVGENLSAHLEHLKKEMLKAAEDLDFEKAAMLRDEIKRLETVDLMIADDPMARQTAIERAVETASTKRGRSTAGRVGQRGGNTRSRRK